MYRTTGYDSSRQKSKYDRCEHDFFTNAVRRSKQRKKKLEEAKEKQKKYYDINAKRVEFEVGTKVLLKEMEKIPGKFNMRWEGPFSIAERKGNVNYKIISQNGKKLLIVHSDRLKN